MRTFLGLDIPETIRSGLAAAVKAVQRSVPTARWVPPENWHLTLVFLGSTSEQAVPGLDRAMGEVVKACPSFRATLTAPGTFPPGRPGRVAWIGVDGGEALGILRERVASGCRRLGFEVEDRPFSPHLTLARSKKPWPRSACAGWREAFSSTARVPSASFAVDGVRLFETVPRPGGVRYRELRCYPLATAPAAGERGAR